MLRKERPKKIYEIVNIHPKYLNEKDKEEKLTVLKKDLILMRNRWETDILSTHKDKKF